MSTNQPLLLLSQLNTPLGSMVIGVTDKGLCLLEFEDHSSRVDKHLQGLTQWLHLQVQEGENHFTKQTQKELEEYFSHQRQAFQVPLVTAGTEFQKKVWGSLLTIPYSNSISYQEQAEKLKNPKAIRAVASANGANRISIIIPCHRVIGKDGSLTGYGGGVERKRWLLSHEMAL